ncbi:MAG: hypothetical protein QXL85_08315 [Candidatus Bathyarchaeia archaeon]
MKSETDYRKLALNSLIGGTILFGAVIFFDMILFSVTNWIYMSMGIMGLSAYDETAIAYYIIKLGTVYLTSGFLGGLYAGYKIRERLKMTMAFPAIVGSLLLLLVVVVQFSLGYRPLSELDFLWLIRNIIVPFLMSLFGSYLGGYTVNWEVEEKPKEERITLIFK